MPLVARQSSFCSKHACCCVEVLADFSMPLPGDKEVVAGSSGVIVRNASSPDAGHSTFTAEEWRAFVRGVKAGEFDLP